ncbi:hypothetical protein PR048_016267 [Dryococelus australis]|uniref:Uncharacterized protein n=1 Tax=Dryococelus australis TaxID=614101 RepID=A0ABQ9HJP8_9NEOP|nr:hypothetical protein PR048_016267 [Dryococelus australis]
MNLKSNEYNQFIRWNNPLKLPAALKLSEEDIRSFIRCSAQFEIGRSPCHSQVVERRVRLVRDASLATCGAEVRNGSIHNRMKSRNELPNFDTKMNLFGARV